MVRRRGRVADFMRGSGAKRREQHTWHVAFEGDADANSGAESDLGSGAGGKRAAGSSSSRSERPEEAEAWAADDFSAASVVLLDTLYDDMVSDDDEHGANAGADTDLDVDADVGVDAGVGVGVGAGAGAGAAKPAVLDGADEHATAFCF